MSLILPALLFTLYYLAVACLCGLLVLRIDRGSAGRTEVTRQDCAAFLLGSGFASFAIGLFQAACWIFLPGRALPFYAAAQLGFVAVAGAAMFRLWPLLKDLVTYLTCDRGRRWRAAAMVLCVGVVGCHALLQSLRPVREYDATTYALDARRLAERRDFSALMGLEPNGDNQFANHNHGSTYQTYLSAALVYGSDVRQDYALRVAQQLLAIHVFLVLCGLGLRVSASVGLFAPPLLLTYFFFGVMMALASRDFYRLLPFVLCIGLIHPAKSWPGLNARGLAFGAAFAFLWNAHSSSLMVAPLLLASMLVFCPGRRTKIVLLAIFVIACGTGGYRMMRSAVVKGSPTADSPFHNANYNGTSIVKHWYEARTLMPDGFRRRAVFRIKSLLAADGIAAVGLLVALPVIGVALALRRHRGPEPWPVHLSIAALFIFVSGLLLFGVLDVRNDKISTALTMNGRYRAHLYVILAPLAAFFILPRLPSLRTFGVSREKSTAVWAAAAVLGLSVGSFGWWYRTSFPAFLDSYAGNEYYARQQEYFRWMGYIRDAAPGDVVLMDYAYLGWYQTDKPILFTQDPRLRTLFTAQAPADVMQCLDDHRVKYVYMIDLEHKAIQNSRSALAEVLASDAFERVAEEKAVWYLYRRVDAGTPSVLQLIERALPGDATPEMLVRLPRQAKASEKTIAGGVQPPAGNRTSASLDDMPSTELLSAVVDGRADEILASLPQLRPYFQSTLSELIQKLPDEEMRFAVWRMRVAQALRQRARAASEGVRDAKDSKIAGDKSSLLVDFEEKTWEQRERIAGELLNAGFEAFPAVSHKYANTASPSTRRHLKQILVGLLDSEFTAESQLCRLEEAAATVNIRQSTDVIKPTSISAAEIRRRARSAEVSVTLPWDVFQERIVSKTGLAWKLDDVVEQSLLPLGLRAEVPWHLGETTSSVGAKR